VNGSTLLENLRRRKRDLWITGESWGNRGRWCFGGETGVYKMAKEGGMVCPKCPEVKNVGLRFGGFVTLKRRPSPIFDEVFVIPIWRKK